MINSKVILLLDKDKELCQALAIFLARYGYDVIRETDRTTLAAISTFTPDIILSGADLEDITGRELLEETKKSFPATEVIMMVGESDMDLAIEYLRLGASDYLIKPINSEALIVALQRACDKRDAWFEKLKYKMELEIVKKNQFSMQQLFDEVPCYISIQDTNFRLTGANKRFKEDFGDYIGSFCYEIYKHRGEPCRDCPVEATFEDGQSHQTEEVVTSQYGEHYNVLTFTAPLRTPTGKITEVMEMSTNITQIRKLQSRLTSLGLLVGSMSHGIRGVLTALDGGLYRLEKGLNTGSKQTTDKALEVVKNMVTRIKTMVLDILYYTKDRGLNWTRVNVMDFANQVATIIKPKAEKHNINYIYELNCTEAQIEIDPGTVNSAIVNILENAIDACIEDRSSSKKHQVVFRVNDNKDYFTFEVLDDGIGMDRQTRENLFTLFFSSKGIRGTGLGLFIANQIIEQHGGSIEVESQPGEGSHFRIKLLKRLPDSIKQKNAAETMLTSEI